MATATVLAISANSAQPGRARAGGARAGSHTGVHRVGDGAGAGQAGSARPAARPEEAEMFPPIAFASIILRSPTCARPYARMRNDDCRTRLHRLAEEYLADTVVDSCDHPALLEARMPMPGLRLWFVHLRRAVEQRMAALPQGRHKKLLIPYTQDDVIDYAVTCSRARPSSARGQSPSAAASARR